MLFKNKSKSFSDGALISLLIRIALGPLFLGMGVMKLTHYVDTVDRIRAGFANAWLPIELFTPFIYIMPPLELLLGLALVLGFQYRYTLVALSLFMSALSFGLMTQGNFDSMIRNLLIVIVALYGISRSSENVWTIDNLLARK